MKIFLTGYMASGKTTVGKQLASRLKLEFIDLDKYIEEQNGLTVSQIFEKEGEGKFRELELQSLKQLLKKNNVVISTGGGTPCFYNNAELMNANGISVYLKVSVDTILARLREAKEERPLLKGKSPEDLRLFISETLQKREPFYMKSHYKVKAKDMDVNVLAEILTADLEKKMIS